MTIVLGNTHREDNAKWYEDIEGREWKWDAPVRRYCHIERDDTSEEGINSHLPEWIQHVSETPHIERRRR